MLPIYMYLHSAYTHTPKCLIYSINRRYEPWRNQSTSLAFVHCYEGRRPSCSLSFPHVLYVLGEMDLVECDTISTTTTVRKTEPGQRCACPPSDPTTRRWSGSLAGSGTSRTSTNICSRGQVAHHPGGVEAGAQIERIDGQKTETENRGRKNHKGSMTSRMSGIIISPNSDAGVCYLFKYFGRLVIQMSMGSSNNFAWATNRLGHRRQRTSTPPSTYI